MARNRQKDGDEDESGSGSHRGSEPKRKNGGHSGDNRTNANGHSDRNRTDNESAKILDLGAYTDTAHIVIQTLSATQNAMRNLAQQYTTHVNTIEQINEIQERCNSLEEQCRDKDENINNKAITIKTFLETTRDQKREIEEEKRSLVEERTGLEGDKKKAEKEKATAAKRLKAQEAEQEIKVEKAFKTRLAELEKQFGDREKELDCGIQKREKENQHRLTSLEEENKALHEKLESLEKERDEHRTALTKAKDDHDDMTRLKESHKAEARRLEMSLKAMENEFGLSTQTAESYIKEFTDISHTIELISREYFKELKTEDTSTIHQKLIDADIAFASIPLSDSLESRELRIARVQVIISSSLCDIVWRPFSSERTVPYPDLISNLSDVSAELAKANHGSTSGPRAAGIWRALTMRAFQSLPPAPLPPTQANPPALSRAERVVSKVLSILSPLVTTSQEPQFRNDLLALANSAISIWSSAQTGELQLIVSSSLDPARHNEWRSSVFDPPSTNSGPADVVSSTRPRIFTLFPHVTSLEMQVHTDVSASLPGSWPEYNQEPRMIETCIHPGTGLRESSALVLKGKAEEEWRRECMEGEGIRNELAELEKKKRELEARGGRNAHSRNSSVADSVSGPTSPTTQWMRGRVVVEQD